MLLNFYDGNVFSCGACRYLSRRVGSKYERPFLAIEVNGLEINAAVDTGGFFLILDPDIARDCGLVPEDGENFDELELRGQRYRGKMHRVTIKFSAQEGEHLEIDVVAYVPLGFYNAPNFLGWPLCLERLRFAFEPSAADPRVGWFHFGALD